MADRTSTSGQYPSTGHPSELGRATMRSRADVAANEDLTTRLFDPDIDRSFP